MRKQLAATPVVIVSLLLLSILISTPPGRSEAAQPTSFPRPKLILILIIDQFRPDYLVRFRPYFVERGFNLLLNGGANFVDCRYDYATTATGPGHATLATGAYGNIHGIVENEWYDRSLGREIACAEDPDTKLVGKPEGTPPERGFSPRNLMGSTIADELRLATNFESRVIGISLKERAAIFPAGHTANAAYWGDPETRLFVSSTYYMPSLPSWVRQFNENGGIEAYCGKPWQALPETPGVGGKILKEAVGSPNEPCSEPELRAWMMTTPFMNEIELNFAREAIKNERLGQGAATDMLTISLSINDFIGHAKGPYSPEVADTTLRTDRQLAAFFADLDQWIGLDNVWIALSSDHAVAPTPRFIQQHRLGMGQFKPATLKPAVEQALSKAFGAGRWVDYVSGAYIYLNLATLEKLAVDRAKAEPVAAEAALSVPGIRAAYTRTQFLTGTLPNDPIARKAANSFNPLRSGDVFLVQNPYAVAAYTETTTTHGSPWNYDAQVPLILWGNAFRPGVYATPCQTIDLAPTLAVALGLSRPSGAEGQPLVPALK